MDIVLKCRGTNLGDNYHLFKMQLKGYLDQLKADHIHIIFERYNPKMYITTLEKIDENTKSHRKIVSLCKYIINDMYEKNVNLSFSRVKYDDEKKFVPKKSNKICLSLGNNELKKKYMKEDISKKIINYIDSSYEKVIIDYPMDLKDAYFHLSTCKLFISNHSGLLFMAYENECPCLIFNPEKHGGFSDSINSHMFITFDEFIIKYNKLLEENL